MVCRQVTVATSHPSHIDVELLQKFADMLPGNIVIGASDGFRPKVYRDALAAFDGGDASPFHRRSRWLYVNELPASGRDPLKGSDIVARPVIASTSTGA
jgi:hypothetical protein